MAKSARKSMVKTTNRSLAAPKYYETRRAKNKNATKTRLILDNSAEAIDAANSYVEEFYGEVSKSFKATAGYGFQHFNQDGVAHGDGFSRLSNESLGIILLQAGEILAQRAAQSGNKAFAEQMGEGGDPAIAKKTIDLARRFLNERPTTIRKQQESNIRANMYKDIMTDLGLNDENEIIPKVKTPKAKSKAESKAESKSKGEGKKSPSKDQARSDEAEVSETVA